MPVSIRNTQRSIRLNRRRITKDSGRALRLLGLEASELSVMFVGDSLMSRLNFSYRGKKGTTDVLSFPMEPRDSQGRPEVLGDIVICMPKALRQSKEYEAPLYQELRRLLIHGLLHLVGYDHEKTPYQDKKMRKKEQELIDALSSMD